MKIIPLSEGSFTIDHTKIFVPFNKSNDDLQQRTTGSLLVEIQPFVVITAKDVIILDTGLGFSNSDGILQIHRNLAENNIEPGSVTKVLLSHLHKDHAGGISMEDPQGTRLSFPNATYYVSGKEMDYAFEKGKPSYYPEDFEYLRSSPQLTLLHNDSGSINDDIRFELSGGHCPYHTVYFIREKEQVVFFGGDVAPQLQQMKSKLVAKYDYDGKKSMELRSEWWQKSEVEHWCFLFYHDIKTPYLQR